VPKIAEENNARATFQRRFVHRVQHRFARLYGIFFDVEI
jgi:hypothetical protein